MTLTHQTVTNTRNGISKVWISVKIDYILFAFIWLEKNHESTSSMLSLITRYLDNISHYWHAMKIQRGENWWVSNLTNNFSINILVIIKAVTALIKKNPLRLTDLNNMTTCLGLFYASRLGNHVHHIFIFIFIVVVYKQLFLYTVQSNTKIF